MNLEQSIQSRRNRASSLETEAGKRDPEATGGGVVLTSLFHSAPLTCAPQIAPSANDEELRMSESIILKAQSLCNYALDGAGPEMTGRDALDECIKDLKMAIEIRQVQHIVGGVSVNLSLQSQSRGSFLSGTW